MLPDQSARWCRSIQSKQPTRKRPMSDPNHPLMIELMLEPSEAARLELAANSLSYTKTRTDDGVLWLGAIFTAAAMALIGSNSRLTDNDILNFLHGVVDHLDTVLPGAREIDKAIRVAHAAQ